LAAVAGCFKLVLPDLHPAGDRAIRREIAGDNVDVAVAVDVADVERRVPRIADFNRVLDEGCRARRSSQTIAGSVVSSTVGSTARSAPATISRSPSPSRSTATARWTPGRSASQ
jgi:hypothetical protein